MGLTAECDALAVARGELSARVYDERMAMAVLSDVRGSCPCTPWDAAKRTRFPIVVRQLISGAGSAMEFLLI